MKKRGLETITKQDVLDYYVNNVGASLKSAAEALVCSRETFRKAVLKYGYKAKPKMRNFHRKSAIPKLSDREWLKEQLKTKTVLQISKELGTTPGNVSDRMTRYQIRSKSLTKSEAVKEGIKKAHPDGRFGKKASNWRGGKRIVGGGYIGIYAPDHPYAARAGYVMEHRLIIEKKLGRYLTEDEIVHHLNGDKKNNSPDNLEVLTRSEHVMRHFEAVKHVRGLQAEVKELEAEIVRLRVEIKKLKSREEK